MKLFYQKIGHGPALIILHGLYGSSDNWVTIARKLAENYSVYLVDQRNHGKSPHLEEHNYQAMAEDIQGLIVSENLEKVILMGHSMGGKTAMLYSALHPEKLSGLIVIDIGPGGYANVDNYSPQVIAHLNIVNAMLSIDFTKYENRGDIEHELARSILEPPVRQFIMKNVHRNHDNSFQWKLNINAIAKALPVIMGPLPLEKILGDKVLDNFPVLFMKGLLSSYVSPDQLLLARKYYPGLTLATIPGAGHWIHAENPEKFMQELMSFLAIR